MTNTPLTQSVRRAAFDVLRLFGFYRATITVLRSPDGASDRVSVGTVAGGIVPATAAGALGLPLPDDLSGARAEAIGYVYSPTVVVQDGDWLEVVEGLTTITYPVEGGAQWNAMQICNLSEVRRGGS